MKIVDNQKMHVKLCDLHTGDVFEYEGVIYMRICMLDWTDSDNPANCVNISSGFLYRIEWSEMVIPVDAELSIKSRGVV